MQWFQVLANGDEYVLTLSKLLNYEIDHLIVNPSAPLRDCAVHPDSKLLPLAQQEADRLANGPRRCTCRQGRHEALYAIDSLASSV